VTDQPAPFQELDFVYTPSRDVAADLGYFTEVMGGRVVFAVEAMGTRVAAVQLTEGPPLEALAAHGWQRQPTVEIPQGPCCSLWTPGGHRVALYQLTRPEVASHFAGRRDF
jgi:hypothetical protein